MRALLSPWRLLVCAYLIALGVSWTVRSTHDNLPPLLEGQSSVLLQEVKDNRELDRQIRMSYFESGNVEWPTAILVHGSPGSSNEMSRLMALLGDEFHVLAPDLPGFGTSEPRIADYSFAAHARYLLQWMDRKEIDRAHVVGFSFGGGAALSLTDLAPERVASLTLLSSITVQEMELLGDYHLNRAVHGLQLGALWTLRELTPHMGTLDGSFLGVPYARSFYDSDQRPLRRILQQWSGPTLIVHGENDFLVPSEAALEAHRLVPQSELVMLDTGHFVVFQQPERPALPIRDFLRRVERGKALTRDHAVADRIARAQSPFDPTTVPAPVGLSLLVLMGLIALATFVSEDLTCIATGLMIANGRIDFLPGVLACMSGIAIGDIGLFLAGKWLGARTIHRAPVRWFVDPHKVDAARRWLERRGLAVILLSRFLPGARLTTYFASGLAGVRLSVFTLYFFIAAAIWTPLIVGVSYFAGDRLREHLASFERLSLAGLLTLLVVAIAAWKIVVPLFTFRGRRRWVSRFKRIARWEYWPRWAFYPPVAALVMARARRYGGLTVCTAANPAIPASGFVGESKFEILQGLGLDDPRVAKTARISSTCADRYGQLRSALERLVLEPPFVLKPDVGERGSNVAIVRDLEQARKYLDRYSCDTLVQQYVPGVEFGVFYVRLPSEPHGSVFSITEKRMPSVTGDGERSLETLILADPRAVAQAGVYLAANAHRLHDVPATGENVQLVELGTHCRGAMFLDGSSRQTDALVDAIDDVSRKFAGFYFGRYDVRAANVERFQCGEFKIIELNGLTSEATHIYDPGNSLLDAYRTLADQWRLAYEIGAQNVKRGHRPTSLWELLRLTRQWSLR